MFLSKKSLFSVKAATDWPAIIPLFKPSELIIFVEFVPKP
jgi:hypothetical protein